MEMDLDGLKSLRDTSIKNDTLYQWSEIALDCIQQFEDRILNWSNEADEEINSLKTRIEELESVEKKYLLVESRLTPCDNCACIWIDDGLNPIGCPYCPLINEDEWKKDEENKLEEEGKYSSDEPEARI